MLRESGGTMRILMTGHLGYIGTVAVPIFLAKNHDVVGLDCDLYRSSTFGESVGPAGDIPSLKMDLREVTPDHLNGFDAVVHLAGLSNDPLGNLNPELTYDINHRATVSLATAAKTAGVQRFVFSSSCSNYGAAGDKIIDESGVFNPVTPYAKSKVMAEADLLNLADEKFSPVRMRSATAYGVSPRLRFDLVLNNLAAWAFTTGEILLKSDGTPWRPIVHIADISRAFLAVVEAPREQVHCQAFNVGATAENYRIIELAEIIREVFPGTKLRFSEGAGPDARCYRVNCDKLAATFPDARPLWTARQGAQQLHEAYTRTGVKLDDFEGMRFQRVAHLKALLESGKLGPDLRWREAA
jgi:nucleoside-diphosphate-sugar epimerase